MAEHAPPGHAVPALRNAKTVTIAFDGRGGVRRLGEDEPAVAPQRGFLLIAGNSKAPDFKVWLKGELGLFNADVLTVPSTRSRCTVLEDKAMVVLRIARPGADPEDVGRQFLALWLEKGRVIIASELNIPDFLGINQWQQTHHAPLSPADLVARLGLRAADRLEPLIERLGNSLDDIEESLIREQGRDVGSKLAHLRRTLIGFRRLVWPQRDVLNTLEIEDLSFLSARDRVRLREAAARSGRLGDELQALSERAVLVHEQILDGRAEQMNKTMLRLTAVTVIILPLTLISGVIGMNLSGIPFAEHPASFPTVVGSLVVVGVAMFWWMHHQKWI